MHNTAQQRCAANLKQLRNVSDAIRVVTNIFGLRQNAAESKHNQTLQVMDNKYRINAPTWACIYVTRRMPNKRY